MDEENDELDAYLEDRRRGRRTIDRYWTHASFGDVERRSAGRRAVLFTNLTWDSAVIGQEVAFPGIREWLEAAVEAFALRSEHELIIRIHPAEVKLPGKQTREPLGVFLQERFPVLPPNVRLITADDPTSSYPLMESADVGLVYTSTTGLELALHGTPIVVAGRTHYRDKGFTVDVSSPHEFEEALDRMLQDPGVSAPDVELARRYAYLFFFRAPLPSPGVEEHVPGLARIVVEDLEELSPGRNEAVDVICDGILKGGSFIA
jgi:capsule polysaccharide modification protein KpsS